MPIGLGDEQLWLCPTLDNATPFNDLSSQGNNGTAQGGLSTITDSSAGGAYAYDFDGSNDYIDLNDPWNFAGNYSYSLWINKDSKRSVQVIGNRDSNADGWLTHIGSTNNFAAYNDTTQTSSSAVIVSDLTWYCMTVTYDGTSLKLYVNGTLVSSVASAQQTSSTRNAEIGRYTNNATYDGRMDDIRFYDRALTQSEISWLSTERGVLGTPPEGLGDEQLWFQAGLAENGHDLSWNGNDASIGAGITTSVPPAGGGSSVAWEGSAGDNLNMSNSFAALRASSIASGKFSMSWWMRADPSQTNIRVFGARQTTVRVRSGRSSNGDVFGQATGSTSISASASYQDKMFHFAVVWENNVRAAAYIDGVMASENLSPGTFSFGDVGGAFSYPDQTYGGGHVDDVRGYDRILTQAEITHLASQRGVLGAPALPTGLGDEQLWLCPSIDDSPDDLSGNGNNGTYVGGAGTISDVAEGGTRSYAFTNSSHYVTGTADLDTTDDFSLSYWYRSNTGNSFGTNYHIFRARNGTRGFNFYKYYSGGTQTYTGTTICRGGASSNSSTPVDYGITTSDWLNWHCFTINWDNSSSTMEYFIDGVSVGTWNASVSGSVDATGTTMILGALGNGTGTANGYIDDLRKYSRKLTQSEISWLATERGVLGTPPEGLGDEQLWLCPSIQDSANDISGNGNNGTYVGSMGTVADTSNGGSRAYDFDGTNDYISNSSLDLRNLPAMSWSAWVKDDKTSGFSSFFSHGLNGQFSNDTYFFQFAGNNRLQINQSVDGTGNATSPTLSTWNHLAVVFDGSGATNSDRLRYFVNGVEVALSYDYTVPAKTGNPASSSTMIGNYVSAPTNFMEGLQDDIRVFNRVLTQAEITHLASQRGVLGSPTATTQYNAFLTHAFRQLFQTRLR